MLVTYVAQQATFSPLEGFSSFFTTHFKAARPAKFKYQTILESIEVVQLHTNIALANRVAPSGGERGRKFSTSSREQQQKKKREKKERGGSVYKFSGRGWAI